MLSHIFKDDVDEFRWQTLEESGSKGLGCHDRSLVRHVNYVVARNREDSEVAE